jgi:hypothetical protein
VLEFVDKLVGAARGTFATSIDTQTVLRLAVSHCLEKALKVDHLTTTNPLKAEKEDFISPIAMKRIEDAAKRNLDLSWALDQTRGKDSFSGRRSENSSGAGNLTTPGNKVEMPDPAKAATAGAARVARAKEAGVADEAQAPHHAPRRGRTPRPPSRRPLGPPDSLGGPRPSLQPRERRTHTGADPLHERGPQAVSDLVGPDGRFDSTRGFPGEGPAGTTDTTWFLAALTTRDLVDRKRQRLEGTATMAAPTFRRLVFSTPANRGPAKKVNSAPIQADTALARFLKAHKGRNNPAPRVKEVPSGDTPVPRPPAPPAPAFACLRELQDFTNPLPSIPTGESLWKAFILHFGGLHGIDAASFTAVWKAAKNRYNKAHDAHFRRFHTDFVAHNKVGQFHSMGIKPGDLVGFLRRERERGAAHPTLKDASASVAATACAQASDGQVQLGAQDSVIRFLKMAKQSEAPDRKERMIVYPDVARLIQIAWQLGPNANIDLAQLKCKLVILLMVDTAARPSDLWRLYCTTVGK